MRKRHKFLFVLCCLALTTLAFAKTNKDKTQAPTVNHPIKFAVSQPVSEIPQSVAAVGQVDIPLRTINRNLGIPVGTVDPALQTEPGPLLNGTPGIDFEGIGVNGFEPSDSNIAVGPSHIVEMVNSEWAIYDKTGNIFAGFPKSLGSIWTSLGGACTTGHGDPIVQYDRLADRWFLSQIGSSVAPFTLCIAVSKTNDPTGAYSLYEYSFGNQLPDYPHYSVWPTATNPAYLQMAHLFLNGPNGAFIGTAACAYDRDAMVAGSASPVQICFTISNDGGFLPSDLDGSTPPPDGSPGYFITFETTSLHQFKLTPNFANPSASTFAGPINIPVSAFSLACGGTGGICVPQSGTAQLLDTLGDRMMYRLAYRNFGDHEALVVNHTVANGSSGAPRWYEIRTPNTMPTIFQQGTYAPNSTFRWMGSMAMDQAGDIAMSYSVSSSGIHPGIAYTGRVPADAPGTMESENILLSGTHFQSGHSRWGDYSAMRIDPSDDCTFWFVNQYLTSDGDFVWGTHIGSFAFPGCGGGTADFTVGALPSSVTITQGGGGTSTVTVTSLGGFNSAVTLDASALPSGVTVVFEPNPVTPPADGSVTSTLTLSALDTAATGKARVTITGTSAPLAHITTINLTVNPDFTLPTNLINPAPANPGQFTGTGMPIGPRGGTFASNVTYTCSAGLPAGATCAFIPPQLDAGTSGNTVTITVQTTGPFTGGASGPQRKLRSQNQRLWLPLSLPLASMVLVGLAGRSLPRRYKIVGLCLALALAGFLVACGGGSSTPPPPPPPPPPISVTVSPTSVNTLFPNLNANGTQAPAQTQQFSAKVNNSTNQTVTWAVSGGSGTPGSIDQTGLYSAPATLPNPNAQVTVTATSAADASKSGQATVNIQTPTPPVTNQQVTVTVREGATVHTTTFNLTVN